MMFMREKRMNYFLFYEITFEKAVFNRVISILDTNNAKILKCKKYEMIIYDIVKCVQKSNYNKKTSSIFLMIKVVIYFFYCCAYFNRVQPQKTS